MTRPALFLSLPFALVLALAACAHESASQTSSSPPQAAAPTDDAAATCKAEPAQAFLGKQADAATIAAARDAAGAKGEVRVLKPGQPMTLDFRHDRLNVVVDGQGMIVKINCG